MGFGENLREALEFADIRQIELSKKTGINIKSIENYIKNDSTTIPSADKAVKIAQVLGVTVEELVNGLVRNKSGVKEVHYYRKSKIFNTLSKFDKYNLEAISSIADTLLAIQLKRNMK